MARLLSWPVGLRWNKWKWLAGPESIGSSSSTSVGDFTQTVASPFGARHIQLSFPILKGKQARRARGLVTALHKGANAVRLHMCDWDGMSLADAGVSVTKAQLQAGAPWNNGLGFDNGENFHISKPNVAVSEAAAINATIIQLSDQFWGHELGSGDWIGFFPLHFGLYEVTEDFGDGRYRIWPPLRKAVPVGSYATQYPTMAMRLKADNLPDADRGAAFLEGLTISLLEVFDYDARDYFND